MLLTGPSEPPLDAFSQQRREGSASAPRERRAHSRCTSHAGRYVAFGTELRRDVVGNRSLLETRRGRLGKRSVEGLTDDPEEPSALLPDVQGENDVVHGAKGACGTTRGDTDTPPDLVEESLLEFARVVLACATFGEILEQGLRFQLEKVSAPKTRGNE